MPKKKSSRPRPLALIILEGFGIAPANPGNAVSEAQPAFFNYLVNHYPAITVTASGEEIGLGATMPGSAESGFRVIGTGAPAFSPRLAADRAFAAQSFETSEAFAQIKHRVEAGGRLHLVGVISSAETLSAFNHLEALLEMGKRLKADTHIHAILDGADAPASSGAAAVERINAMGGEARIASVSGRWYALDRKGHAARLDKALAAIARTEGQKAASASEAIAASYRKKIFDEEFAPSVIEGSMPIASGDVVICFNYRSGGLEHIAERLAKTAYVATLVEYGQGLPALIETPVLAETLPSTIARQGFRQLRLADGEAFADITSWFDATSQPLEHEQRRIVNVPEDPTEAAEAVAREFVAAVESGEYDVIITAFAQADRAAHGNPIEQAVEAVRGIDAALETMVTALLASGGAALITASHGAVERTIDFSGLGGAHTSNPVPFILVGKRFEGYSLGLPEAIGGDLSLLKPAGSLLDIAPTLLSILGISQPSSMVGRSLVS